MSKSNQTKKIYILYGPMDVEFNSKLTQSAETAQDPVAASCM